MSSIEDNNSVTGFITVRNADEAKGIINSFIENNNIALNLDPVEYIYRPSIDYISLINPDTQVDEEYRRRMQIAREAIQRATEESAFKVLLGNKIDKVLKVSDIGVSL